MMKLLRDPLVHFALAAALLFAGYALLNRGERKAAEVQPVHIGEGEIHWLQQTFTNQWQRHSFSRRDEEPCRGSPRRGVARARGKGAWSRSGSTRSYVAGWRRNLVSSSMTRPGSPNPATTNFDDSIQTMLTVSNQHPWFRSSKSISAPRAGQTRSTTQRRL